ncbi:adenosylcobinamide-GDP ribazoletransferase [Lihuaxuella thermophila]|uniref:Adenosylcobinamide-GDP ribazoletransferase n=1 Tax=Lihuaxuella thermophila TaxID=1173111 RepID=A0A1H8AI50_9BACL|nr:adenosylcobinamide-GDP ribazoletransferase [Lihuaxuella thermophila]SEM69197.1 adenosylcobinamide-GDP ribazoletransferase [Lihuaxuella thermophila]
MNAFFHAVAFLTRIPVPLSTNREDWEKSPMWYPLAGLLLGIAIVLFDTLIARWFPLPVRAVLDAACWAYLTGGLHLDGWMDTADGLGSYRERERTLEIMKDSRVGAMGVLAGVFAVLLKVGSLISLPAVCPLFVPVVTATVLGRTAVVWVMFVFPYIQANGTGKGMKEQLTLRRLLFAFICAIVPVMFLSGWLGLVLFALALGVGWLAGWRVTRRLGGCTGDIYGAVIEGTEIVILLVMLIPGVNELAADLAPAW